MLRKFLLFLFFLCLFFGCEDAGNARAYHRLDRWMEENGKIKVLSTIGMIDDLVKEIAGDRVDSIALILGEIDPHSYELVKGDEEKFSCADVIFYNGLGLEHGASLAHRLSRHARAVSLGDALLTRHPEVIYVGGGQRDPHIWMDISLWMEAGREVMRVLMEVDPEGREVYRERGERLFQQMQRVHEAIVESLHEVPPEKRYLATSHDAFNYFVRAYFSEPGERESGAWQERFAAPEGIAPDGKLSSAHLRQVIDFLKSHQVHCLFPESNVSRDSLKKICESCLSLGHKMRLSQETLYGDCMGPPGSDADTYLKMVQHNAATIKKELLCQ